LWGWGGGFNIIHSLGGFHCVIFVFFLVGTTFTFATDIFPKLQADISEPVNLLRFANMVPTFSNRARPESTKAFL
jgi:hypothetical protein